MGSFKAEKRPDSDRDYWIENNRVYWDINGETVSITEEDWAAIVAGYSREGYNNTKAHLAQEFDIPRSVLEVMLKRAGVYKASPPFTNERMEEAEDLDDLVNATLEMKAHRYFVKLQRAELTALRKEVDELRTLENNRGKLARAFAEAAQDIEVPKASPKEKPRYRIRAGKIVGGTFRVHATSADAHCGLLVWDRESWRGEDYDSDIGAERVKEHGVRTAEWIASQPGECEVCYLSDAGDIFHATPQNKTVSGKVSLQVDGRPRKVWEMVLRARMEAIEAIRQVAGRVEVRQVPGNHEGELAFFLQDALRLRYDDTPDVTIHNTVNEQDWFVVGETMHLITHGSRIASLAYKAKAAFEVMAREAAGDDFGKVKAVKAYCAHLHSPEVKTQGRHMEIIRLPAMAETDDYAQSLYFIHTPEARLFRLAEDGEIDLEKRLRF